MDSKVLEQLYRKYERELYLYIYSICKDKHAAEMQQEFTALLFAKINSAYHWNFKWQRLT